MWFSVIYSLDSGELAVEGDCLIRENDAYKVVLMCNLPEDEIEHKCDALLRLGKDAADQLNGRYTVLLYNKKTRQVDCFQDFLCGLAPLYYTQKDGKIYLSTSLRTLLQKSDIPREFDKKAFRMFEIQNAVYGGSTLIKNVRKLPLQKALHITSQGIAVQEDKLRFQPCDHSGETTIEACEELWGACVKRSVLRSAASEKEVAMPLSSGYDSNCILWNLAQDDTRKIHCYSVGGAKGISEVSAAEEIAKQYASTCFSSAEVSPDTFQSLPDIVWRLEGSMYEQGAFLQYELAKAIHSDGGRTIICGEGSDEIFSDGFYHSLTHPEDKQPALFSRKRSMYVWLAQYISRKSTLIMNSFGIVPRYPFSDTAVVPLANYVKQISRTKGKAFHKAYCKKCFPEEVMQRIHSVGGKTDLTSLFVRDPYEELKALKKYAKIHFGFSLSVLNAYEDLRMRIVNLVKGPIYDVKKEKERRFANSVIVHLYLKVFGELYLSGKYDGCFHEGAFTMKLQDVLGN